MKSLLFHNFSSETKGIVYYALAMFFVATMNLTAKALQPEYHPIEILFHRNFYALLMTFAVLVWLKKLPLLKTTRMKAHLGRGLMGTLSVTLAFATFGMVPATEATVLIFTAPLFVGLISSPFLGEKVGPYRWSAIIIGFIGVLIIAQPQNITSLPGVAMGLGTGLSTAFVYIFLRDLGKTEDPWVTIFYFLLIGTIVSGLCLPFIGKVPDLSVWPLLALVAVLGFVNQVTKTVAFRYAEASLLAPLIYTMLIWTTLFGWWFWDEVPSVYTFFGAALIISSNLFISWREKKRKKERSSEK